MADPAINSSNVNALKIEWFAETLGYVTAEPIVFDSKVYVTDWEGYAYCFELTSGKTMWRKRIYVPPTPGNCRSGRLVSRLVGACLPYTWYGLAGNGVMDKGSWYMASVGGKPGKILENGEPGKIYAVKADNGTIIWQHSLSQEPFSGSLAALSVQDDWVYAGLSSVDEPAVTTARIFFKKFKPSTVGEVFAFDRLTGRKVWSRKTVGLLKDDNLQAKGAAIWGGFSVDTDLKSLYFGTGNNYGPPPSKSSDSVIALNHLTGEFKWQYQAVSNDQWLPSRDKGPDFDFGCPPRLFDLPMGNKTIKAVGIGNKNGHFYVFDRKNGSLIWRANCNVNSVPDDGIRSRAAVLKDRIFVWSNNKQPNNTIKACCLNASDGSLIWSRILKGKNATGAGAISGDLYFVSTYSGQVYALRIDNGEIAKTLEIPGASSGSNLIVDKDRIILGVGVPRFYKGNPKITGVYALTLRG